MKKENLIKLRTFLIVAAVLALGYGLGLSLMPAFVNSTYGLGTSASDLLLARFFGAELLVVGLAAWLSKDLTGVNVQPIVMGSLVGDVIATIFALMATLNGVMNSAGWSAVAIYSFLSFGFAYFQFMAPPK